MWLKTSQAGKKENDTPSYETIFAGQKVRVYPLSAKKRHFRLKKLRILAGIGKNTQLCKSINYMGMDFISVKEYANAHGIIDRVPISP